MAVAIKSELDDEEYDAVSDYAMSETETDLEDDRTSNAPPTELTTTHKSRPSELKTLSCPYEGCSKTFNRKARLNEHLRSHTNTRPFKCLHCPKDFLRDSHLKHHEKSAHSDVRDYKCSHSGCEKSFATGTRLRRHEATHSGHEKYRCTEYEGCNQTFRKKETLARHILQAHEKTKPFSCTDIDSITGEPCKKAFGTAAQLKSHQRSIHDATKFSCGICVEAQKLVYRDATKAVEFETPYFATYAALRRHIDAEHPPTCSHCKLAFKTPKELSRHVELLHNIVDPDLLPRKEAFECLYTGCDRSFSRKGNLNVHFKTVHEKRRDFVCGQTVVSLPEITSEIEVTGCGRDFTSKSTLEEHIRTAHLGMQAKRVERNKKRKAEKVEAEHEFSIAPKKRKARKDKGAKKTSAIKSLVGFPVYRRGSIVEVENDDDDDEEEESEAYSVYDDEEEEEEEEGFELTGSMVMHGSQFYHGDNVYHFDSSSSSFSAQQPTERGFEYDGVNVPMKSDNLAMFYFEDSPFDDNFNLSSSISRKVSSAIAPLDLHRSAPTLSNQWTSAFDSTEIERYAVLSSQHNSTKHLSDQCVPVDPRLL